MLNDGIMHLVKAHVTVCWEQVIGNPDLQEFAKTKPTWDAINDMAHQIFNECIAGNNFSNLRDQPDSEHDKRWENQLLFN